jgi:hypothetical protein
MFGKHLNKDITKEEDHVSVKVEEIKQQISNTLTEHEDPIRKLPFAPYIPTISLYE